MSETYDLVIRGGIVVDGTGGEPRELDVAISGDRIASIGKRLGPGREEIDASGKIVTPGFVDIHTHYDGQATWEHRMVPSSQHGVTTVVVGNCGVGFAPCRRDQHDMLVRLMEGVEDVPEPVMTEGVPWDWESFPEYLDTLEARSFDVDLATQLPHSPLRVYVMGERGADREPPTDHDLAKMRALVAEALRAGALGVTTSRSLTHRERKGRLAPSVSTEERELLALAEGMRDAGSGVFQLIPDLGAEADKEFEIFRHIVETSGRPLSFTLLQIPGNEGAWRRYLKLLAEAKRDGLEIKGQVFTRAPGTLYGLDLSLTPFFLNPSYQEVIDLPLAEKVERLRDPELRARILSESPVSDNPILLAQVEKAEKLYELHEPINYEPTYADSIGAQAAERGVAARDLAYDKLLEKEGRALFFSPGANYVDGTLDAARQMMGDDNTVIALGDGGAHYGMICDASYSTYLLMRWVRDAPEGQRFKVGEAVRMLTRDTAVTVGLDDRGLIAPGWKADLNVIDLDRLRLESPRPVFDLPAGGRRLTQRVEGYDATILSGVVTYRRGEPTGALPGKLVRGKLAAGRRDTR